MMEHDIERLSVEATFARQQAHATGFGSALQVRPHWMMHAPLARRWRHHFRERKRRPSDRQSLLFDTMPAAGGRP